jgi:hypothetical protein
MTDIKRYSPVVAYGNSYNDVAAEMDEREDGEWVRWGEFEKLKAENKELAGKLTWWEYKARDLHANIVEWKTRANKFESALIDKMSE